MNKGTKIFVGITSIFILLYLVNLGLNRIGIKTCLLSKPFTAQNWITHTDDRYCMALDLIESKILLGKREAEIIELFAVTQESVEHNELNLNTFHSAGFMDHFVLSISFQDEEVINAQLLAK